MKNKLLAGLAVGIIMLGIAGMANATPITVQLAGAPASNVTVTDFSLRNATLRGLIDVDYTKQYLLNDNDSITVDFFDLTLTSKDNGNLTSSKEWEVNAQLAFVLPTPLLPGQVVSGEGEGTANAHRVKQTAHVDGGTLVWETASTSLTDVFGNVLKIDLLNNVWLGEVIWGTNLPTKTSITAKITNMGGGIVPPPPTPNPEPATMLLFGTGLAGLIGARRKRK